MPISNIINPVADIANVANTVAGPQQYQTQQDQSAEATQAPEATKQIGIETVQGIPATVKEAQGAIAAPAQFEQQEGVKQGELAQNVANAAALQALKQQQDTKANYDEATRILNQKQLDLEAQVQKTQEAAKIDPNQYLSNLGVGQRTVTALGLLLSGLGSGLTGQPNMAYDILQKNIQRDIEAQQKNFLNQANILAEQRGIIQTAQDRQSLAAQAFSAATASVMSGLTAATDALSLKVGSNYAPAKGAQVKNTLQQTGSSAINAYDQQHAERVKSGNMKQLGLGGAMADGISNALHGKPAIQLQNPRDFIHNIAPNQPIVSAPAANPTPVQPSIQEPKKGRNFLEKIMDAYKMSKEMGQ